MIILVKKKSYLFSFIINNSTYDKNSNLLTLSIQENLDSMITFTDRPIKDYIVNNNIIYSLTKLFSKSSSFNEEPPNGIIIIDNKQYPYTFKINNIYDNIVEFKIYPLMDKQQNYHLTLNNFSNKLITIFCDNYNPDKNLTIEQLEELCPGEFDSDNEDDCAVNENSDDESCIC